jgi:hypothetical protein
LRFKRILVVFKSGDFMKKLILLATLFLLTSCDAITGAKPKPSTTATPLASESPDQNAPIASGTTGTETPGPTTNGLPTPSQMPTNPVTAGNSVLPPAAPPTSVTGNGSVNPGLNQTPVVGVPPSNSVTDPTKPVKPGAKLPPPSGISPDPSSIAAFNGDPGNISGNPNTKANSKDPKAKTGKGAKGASESLDPSLTNPSNPNTSVPKTSTPQTIAEGGIGAAKVGMTLAELKKNLKKSARFETQTDFTPGYDALAVKQQGKVQFYIPYPKKKKVTDNDQVKILVTDNPIYKTAEGISPGMSIKKASEVYGDARLGYNPKASVGEIVMFARQPGELLFFTSGAERNGRAGIYPAKQQSKEQQVTNKYGNSGRIKQITVVCPDSVCTSEQQP